MFTDNTSIPLRSVTNHVLQLRDQDTALHLQRQRDAVRTVCREAIDVDDALHLLDVLGLDPAVAR